MTKLLVIIIECDTNNNCVNNLVNNLFIYLCNISNSSRITFI